MSKVDLIRKINKNIVHEDGTIDSFDKQLIDLLSGEFDVTMPLVIDANTNAIDYVDKIKPDKPLVMNVSTFIKLQNKHSLTLSVITNLKNYLKDSVLAVESMTEKESIVLITDKIHPIKGEPYIISCRYEKRVGKVQINEITSFYDRNGFENFLINTYKNGKTFYKNKKTEQYFNLNRLQLPQELEYALSDSYTRSSFTKSQVQKDLNGMVIGITKKEVHQEMSSELQKTQKKRGRQLGKER